MKTHSYVPSSVVLSLPSPSIKPVELNWHSFTFARDLISHTVFSPPPPPQELMRPRSLLGYCAVRLPYWSWCCHLLPCCFDPATPHGLFFLRVPPTLLFWSLCSSSTVPFIALILIMTWVLMLPKLKHTESSGKKHRINRWTSAQMHVSSDFSWELLIPRYHRRLSQQAFPKAAQSTTAQHTSPRKKSMIRDINTHSHQLRTV